ncbi:MAG: twin-arginine translocation signal domain-containing protein [Burkholderiales bacterium]
MKHSSALPFVAAAFLAACSTPSSDSPDLQTRTSSQVTAAATTPLADLNLVRADIPAVLSAAQKAPYAVPADRACAGLATEVRSLDAALGADLDTPATTKNPSLIERGTNAASDAAGGALKGAAESIVPFRGWVRKLSGAERYSKDVASAIAAGTIRRAFIKGLGAAAGCAAPGAPRT